MSVPIRANAAFVVALDLDTDMAGIQNMRTVAASESFDVDVAFELTDGTSLSSYEISLQFDSALFDFDLVNSSEGDTRGFDLRSPSFVVPVDSDSGNVFVSDIDGASFFGTADPGVFQVARLRFTAQAPAGPADVMTELSPGFFDGDDVAFDASFPLGIPLTPDFRSSVVTITAVPEPSSVVLFIAAGTATTIVRRRRRRITGEV